MHTENLQVAALSPPNRNTRILVADDDDGFTRLMADHLRELGFLVETARDGREGLSLFRTGYFPIVFVDLHMPGMDGMELLKHIKHLDPRTAVVVITGYGTIDLAVSAVKNGAYEFILKPLSLERLSLTVERAIEWRDLARQVSVFRGLTLALVASIPFWVITSLILAVKYFGK